MSSAYDRQKALELFREWFKLHPNIKNPTDINRVEKWEFFQQRGWDALYQMQRARKAGEVFVRREHQYELPLEG